MKSFYIGTCFITIILLSLLTSCEKNENDSVLDDDKTDSISIVCPYEELYIGNTVKLTAEVYNKKGDLIEKSVNWSISGPGNISLTYSASTIITVKDTGTIEITAEKDGVSTIKEIEVVSENSGKYSYLFPSQLDNAKITFTYLVLIYSKVDIPKNAQRGHPRLEYSFNKSQVDYIVKKLENFEKFSAKYTNDEVGFNLAVVTLDDRFPLTDFYWDHNRKSYEWLERDDLTWEMDTYVGNQTGWFDNIHVFYPMDGEYGPHAAYGGGGYIRDNITLSQQNIRAAMPDRDYYVGMWHESIHGLEMQYWNDPKRSGSCTRGKDPEGNDIALHGQPAFGYTGNDGGDKTINYYHWMGDITTGNIRDLREVGWEKYSSGANTQLGLGRNGMYDWGPVRYEYEFKSGGPFPQD